MKIIINKKIKKKKKKVMMNLKIVVKNWISLMKVVG